jgi:hypothetical protein
MVGPLAPFALARGLLGNAGALALLGGVAALGCGGRSHSERGTPETRSADAGAGGSGAGGNGAAGGLSAGGAAMAAAGTPARDYAGVVLASVVSDGATKDYSAFAAFAIGSGVSLDACSACCCYHSIGISLPLQPPNAAGIELTTADDDEPLASLVPDSGTLHGSWLLNAWGIAGASDYASVVSKPWAPHQTLRVTAQGDEIHAFSGEVRTGVGFNGLTPELAGKPLVLERTRPLELAWIPEGADEWVTLILQQSGDGVGLCICSTPDSAGTLTLTQQEVEKFGAGAASVKLLRSIAARAPSDNASITLVSQVGVAGTVDFR